MELDFETLKKIEAGNINVGMIQNSAGDILWRKKYDKLNIGLAEQVDDNAWEWKGAVQYTPNNVITGTNTAANNYFWYNDRVDIFEPVNLNAKLVVSWYENTPQLNNTSLLLSQAVTYTASSAMQFNYPIHAPGILRELGRIEFQNSFYHNAATDEMACVSSDITEAHPENNWSRVLEGATNIAKIQNRVPVFQSVLTSTPSTSNYVVCTVARNSIGYSFRFLLKAPAAASGSYNSVSFFVVDNNMNANYSSPQLITLFPGSRNAQTIESPGLNLDILQVGTYVSSSGDYINGSKFTSLTTTATKYLTFTLSSASYDFRMNASGELYSSNKNVTSSYSYCNIYFVRPSTRFTGLRITYTQDSERNYDYGVFSNIDRLLCPANVLDSTTAVNSMKNVYTGYGAEVVKHSCKGESGTKTVTYNISSLDTTSRHSICVKYIKDYSGNTGTDTFKITKIEFVEDVDYDFHYDTTDNYYTLTVNNYGSTDASFEWLYVYIEGSAEDYIQPDEAGGDIPAGGSYDFWLHTDPIPEQSGRIFCIFKCNGQYHTIYQ